MKSFKGTIHAKTHYLAINEDVRTNEKCFSVCLFDALNRVVMEPIFIQNDQSLYKILEKKINDIDEILSGYYLSAENKLMSTDEIKSDINSEFYWLVGWDTYELRHQIKNCESMIKFYDQMTNDILADPEILDCPSDAQEKIQEYAENKKLEIREIDFINKLLADRELVKG